MQLWRVAAAAMVLGAAVGNTVPALAAKDIDDVKLVTLGTGAGPLARIDRAQPATLLRWGKQVILVDAGDGERRVVFFGSSATA